MSLLEVLVISVCLWELQCFPLVVQPGENKIVASWGPCWGVGGGSDCLRSQEHNLWLFDRVDLGIMGVPECQQQNTGKRHSVSNSSLWIMKNKVSKEDIAVQGWIIKLLKGCDHTAAFLGMSYTTLLTPELTAIRHFLLVLFNDWCWERVVYAYLFSHNITDIKFIFHLPDRTTAWYISLASTQRFLALEGLRAKVSRCQGALLVYKLGFTSCSLFTWFLQRAELQRTLLLSKTNGHSD